MKYLIYLLLLLCLGCNKNDKPKVEIYLLNKRIPQTEGVLFKTTSYYKNLDSIYKKWYGERYVDTIKREFIYGGKFTVVKSNLEYKPFIADEEISSFNSQTNIIAFDSSVVSRIRKLKPSMGTGTQFVIAVNKQPIVTGYFWNILSSFTCQSYNIVTVDPFGLDKKKTNLKHYWLGNFTDGYFPPANGKSKRPPYPPKLLEALRQTNRLIE
ncbi:MAG: hypothetical protein ACLGH8_11415 [Bacteroidia bacterium]